jgi:hypothetical protein
MAKFVFKQIFGRSEIISESTWGEMVKFVFKQNLPDLKSLAKVHGAHATIYYLYDVDVRQREGGVREKLIGFVNQSPFLFFFLQKRVVYLYLYI